MTRHKVKMAFIENDKTRKATYNKRKKGLLKKAHELATLCDVPIGIIINSAFDLSPEIWPSREAVGNVVSHWQTLSVPDKTKKMMNQETYLDQRLAKETETCKKLSKENRELEMEEVMFDCFRRKISPSQIKKSDLCGVGGSVTSVIDQYLKDINRRIEILNRNDGASSSSVVHAASTTYVAPMPRVEMGSSSAGFYDMIRERIQDNLNMKQTIKDLDLNQRNSGEHL